MGELETILQGKSLADYTNTRLRLALGAVLYTNTADMWYKYLTGLGYSGSVSAMLQKYYVDYAVPAQFQNYILAGAGIFNPTDFFTDGSVGYIYDNNDLSSFYLDSAGVTPATVNGLVGLQLDKSGNLALGADFCVNGGFTTDTTWIKGTGWAISGGVATHSGGVAGTILQGFSPVIGRAYKITYTVSGRTAGNIAAVFVGGTTVAEALHGSNGARSCILIAVTGNNTFGFSADGPFDGSVDNYTIQELPGNHRYQTTTGSKPILRGTPVGGNIVTNGDFTSGTGWTLDAGITISGGTLNFATADATPFAANIATVEAGRVYKAVFTVSGFSAGGVSLANNGTSVGAVFTQNGVHEQYFTSTETGLLAIRARLGATTLSVDNFTLFDVTADSVTAPYGLQYDGIDDFLTTASVDFTATDKMAVVMGVRKLSDATAAVFAELSASVSSNNGAFTIFAPVGANQSIVFSSKGTTERAASYTNALVAATTTIIVSALGDISGDSSVLRINSVQRADNLLDQGTGNYGNYALFFGRRGGTTLPYNGLDFGGICVNKTLTASQLSSAERWTASRTGVTI